MEYAWDIPFAGRPKQTFVILHNVVNSAYQEICTALFFLHPCVSSLGSCFRSHARVS